LQPPAEIDTGGRAEASTHALIDVEPAEAAVWLDPAAFVEAAGAPSCIR
jgi:hypothetical protein